MKSADKQIEMQGYTPGKAHYNYSIDGKLVIEEEEK
jgi:hypothetical protein